LNNHDHVYAEGGIGMARNNRSEVRLDAPKGLRATVLPRRGRQSSDRFGRFTEAIARGMGTPGFLILLTLFVALWMVYNTTAPEGIRFDSAAIGFTALTLILSLQASYAAPLILLAQNRQDDRDRVQIEQDRQRAERNLADTEYLAREVVALRLAMKDLASKDFIRAELRAFLDELDRDDTDHKHSAEREQPKGLSSSGRRDD
jgi:uncharacterized membrane protein